MTTRTLEQAFARFRDERDLEALAEVFDRTAPQLLELARHLSRGGGEAEDLVQSTLLAALEGAERFEEGRELVPWLLGILANKARRERDRNTAGRRENKSPDELAAAASEDPAVLAEGVELQAAVASALGRVPATYREVLRSHLAEGRAPEEIARRTGRASGTVRVQLHRGVRWLRRLLPAGFALGAGAVLAPRGLAAVRAEVLRAAGAPAALVPTLTLGGLLLAKKLVLVAVMLLLTVSTWWLVRDGEGAEPPATLAAAQPPVELAPPMGPELAPIETEEHRVPATDPDAGSAESSEPYGALSVVLTWWDGTPAQGVGLRFMPWGERQPEQAFQLALTDEHGHAETARIHEGGVFVEVEHLGIGFRAEVRREETSAHPIVIPRGCDVVGRVLDAHGVPAAGASIWVSQGLMEAAYLGARAKDDGSFLVRSMPDGFGVFATADGGGSSATPTLEELEWLDEGTRRVELRLRGESAELQGRVSEAHGAPIAGARVSVYCSNDSRGREISRWPHLRLASGADGGFSAGGLSGNAHVRVAAPGFAAWDGQVTLQEGRTTTLEVILDQGFCVSGSVSLPEGTLVPGAGVRVQVNDYRDPKLWTAADGEGRYVIENIAAGAVVLVVSDGDENGRQAQKRITGRVGETLTWDVVFGAGSGIRGVARDETGLSLTGWRVRAWPTSGTGAARSAEILTDEQGRFLIPDLTDTPYDVVLFAPEDVTCSQPRVRAERVLAGGKELELVVHGEREPASFLSGRVLDSDGKPVHPGSVWAYREDGLGSVGNPEWSEGERFRLGPLLAGAYRLSLSVAGFPDSKLHLELAEGEERDLGDIVLPRPGRVELTLRDRDGRSIGQPMSVFLQEAGRYVHRLTSADGFVYESDALFPGPYELRIMSGAFAPDRPVSFDVREGETTTREVTLAPGRTVTLELRVPESQPLPRRARCQLRDPGGAVLAEFEVGRMVSPGKPDRLGETCALPFGRILYSIRTFDGWSALGEFEVSRGEGWSQWETVWLTR